MDWPYSNHIDDILDPCMCPLVERVQRRNFFLTNSLSSMFVLQIQLFTFGLSFISTQVRCLHRSMVSILPLVPHHPPTLPRCCFESDDLFDDESECFDVERFSRYVVTCWDSYLYTIHAFLIHYNIRLQSCSLNWYGFVLYINDNLLLSVWFIDPLIERWTMLKTIAATNFSIR